MNRIEHQHQCAFTDWFKLQYPQYYPLYTSSLMGANLTIQQATIAKAKGCKKGWPDIQIMVRNRGYGGFFIELKSPKPYKSYITDEQNEAKNNLMRFGYYCEIAYGWIEAKEQWEWYIST